jgi:endogenous inhibitor of DNA gyrase (YacG/DUF329 family)
MPTTPPEHVTCPTCRAPAAPRTEAAFPFCSPRCRLIDLGRWLDGDYRVPALDDAPGAEDEN